LPPTWSKAAFGIALGNFLLAGGLYSHTAAKLLFIRFFRNSRHLHTHTVLGWAVWTFLCFVAVAIAFVLAIAVPIFTYLIGIAASLFASWCVVVRPICACLVFLTVFKGTPTA
jgi:hypothetical protein